ncbi:hypothetical protein CCACVL1_28137 [Corchorus capsularis]|uniref:Uncharacterized protein n=1 Tax=Corchorus capsularis TaxID=210143 RepID=A0A1R3G7H2_COCAP|nr:hypothetical protein CCACVL1_28137 [Corchorus capsularis]
MAADVAQKMEAREASAIFIEGLISTIELDIKEVDDHEEKEFVGSSSNEKLHIEYNNQKAQMLIERACQCSCNNLDSPDLNIIEEPVTAPF